MIRIFDKVSYTEDICNLITNNSISIVQCIINNSISVTIIDWILFNGDGQPDTLELATTENTISSVVEKQSSYQDLKYSVSDIEEFSSFAVKVVMLGVDPAFAPKIQDIRAVAAF